MSEKKVGVAVDQKICMTCSKDLTNEGRYEVHMCADCTDKFGNQDYIGMKRKDIQFLVNWASCQYDIFAGTDDEIKNFKRIKEEYRIRLRKAGLD